MRGSQRNASGDLPIIVTEYSGNPFDDYHCVSEQFTASSHTERGHETATNNLHTSFLDLNTTLSPIPQDRDRPPIDRGRAWSRDSRVYSGDVRPRPPIHPVDCVLKFISGTRLRDPL